MNQNVSDTLAKTIQKFEAESVMADHDAAIAQCVTALSVNENGIIGHATPPLCLLFGWLPNELDGKPMEVLLPERFREMHRLHMASFFRNPKSRQMGTGAGPLYGWNEREQREFPIVIGLEPRHYLKQNWAIATLTQPLQPGEKN
jgi:hypothetical protein